MVAALKASLIFHQILNIHELLKFNKCILYGLFSQLLQERWTCWVDEKASLSSQDSENYASERGAYDEEEAAMEGKLQPK
jgi:hypothetical protein